jgi:hypothetical protein
MGVMKDLRLNSFNSYSNIISKKFQDYIAQYNIIDGKVENRFYTWLHGNDPKSLQEGDRLALAESRLWPVNEVLSAQKIDDYLRASDDNLSAYAGMPHTSFRIRVIARPVVRIDNDPDCAAFETGCIRPGDVFMGYRVSVQMEPAHQSEIGIGLSMPFPGLIYEQETPLHSSIGMRFTTHDQNHTLIPVSMLHAAAVLKISDSPVIKEWHDGDTIINHHEVILMKKTQASIESVGAELKNLDLSSSVIKDVEKLILTLYEHARAGTSKTTENCIGNLSLFLERALKDAAALNDHLITHDLATLVSTMQQESCNSRMVSKTVIDDDEPDGSMYM